MTDGAVMAEKERRIDALESEIAEVVGLLNATHGRLVELVGRAVHEGLWEQDGIHTPGHWLAWKAGMAPARAAALVTVAERRAELPTAVGALVAGELSVDAAIEVARRAPASHERSITDFASQATISQLRRTLRLHAYDRDTEDRRPRPAEETRSFTMGTDDLGWWCRGRLPVDEGALVETAVRTARDDLFRQDAADRSTEGPDSSTGEASAPGQPGATAPPSPDLADGIVAVAEAALAAGAAAHPGTDRYRVHLHLHHPGHPDAPDEASPDPTPRRGGGTAAGDHRPEGAPVLAVHLGPVLPTALRHLLTCDGVLRPVHHVDGVPVSVGRRTRVVSARLHRLIERRDDGCAVPGCHRTTGIEVHHIVHWEHGGPTDTGNLLALCRRHHRLHHTGHLHITGDADLPRGVPGALAIADASHRPLLPGPTPTTCPDRRAAATQLGVHPRRYHHPLGERLDPRCIEFTPNTPPDDTTISEPPPGPGPPGPPEPPEPPGQTGPQAPPAPDPRTGDRSVTAMMASTPDSPSAMSPPVLRRPHPDPPTTDPGSTMATDPTPASSTPTESTSTGAAAGAKPKVKGPASYFPSIEKTYGEPIEVWLDRIRASPLTEHMELVAWLKDEHGLGHGHANALVAHVRAER